MADRQFFASRMSEMDRSQMWIHQNHDRHQHLENGSPMLPAYDIAVSGVNSLAYLTAPRRNNYLPLSFSMEALNYGAINSGMLQNTYLHPASSVSSSQFQSNQVLHESSDNRLSIGYGSSIVDANMNNGRVSFKENWPSMPMVSDREYSDGYYCAGASSNLHISSDPFQWKPLPSPQYHSFNPFPSCWNGYLAGEGSQRNVRSRHCHAVHRETQLAELFSSRSIPYHFQSTANISGSNVGGQPFHSMGISDRSVARHHIQSLANLGGPNMAGQCHHYSHSIDPHNRILSSDSYYSNYEMNQFLTGSSITNGDVEQAYNSSLTQSRYSNTMLSAVHCASTRGMELGYSSYDERSTTCSAIQSNPPMGFAATSLEDAGPSRMEAAASYRYSRPLSTTGHSIERSARARNSYDRLHWFPYSDDYTNNQWLSEFVDIVDPLTSSWFDELMGTSLDVDEMSYEELLSLEEMIGDVSTGLSKDLASMCLTEMPHCSSHQTQDDDEERKCVICQEEYADGEKLGKLSCGHDFHTSCIKKWLLMKNACPICKAPALSDSSKEKQVISHN